MTEIEQAVIEEFLNVTGDEISYTIRSKIDSLLTKIFKEIGLDKVSEEFINHPAVLGYLSYLSKRNDYAEGQFLALWFHIAWYLKNKSDEKLKIIEASLEGYLKTTMPPEEKAAGTAIPPMDLVNPQMIKTIFLIDDKNLTDLFLNHLPAPRSYVFKGHTLPGIFAERERKSILSLRKAMDEKFETQYIKIQRQFRKKQRMAEEVERMRKRRWYGISTEDAKDFIKNANTPYTPKCDSKLSERIVTAARKVKLFSSVTHCTAATALENIFNDGLYGRRTLLNFYMFFRKASLDPGDLQRGDGNVICLGTSKIDPKAKHGIELEFDLVKISKDNPCVFYKQRDFAFCPAEPYRVQISDLSLSFCHTELPKSTLNNTSSFFLFDTGGASISGVDITNDYLISYNLKEMQQILTLNFFRFIDTLELKSQNSDKLGLDKENINKIYEALSKLNNEELVNTLQQIGKHMSDTMEFNIYGAYKIDFDALNAIKVSKNKDSKEEYKLELKLLIDELKANKLEILEEAMKKIPQIFDSYRFIDYLISKIDNQLAIQTLQMQRKKCTLPLWLEEQKERYHSGSGLKK